MFTEVKNQLKDKVISIQYDFLLQLQKSLAF